MSRSWNNSKNHQYWLNKLKKDGELKGYSVKLNYQPIAPIPPFDNWVADRFFDVVWFKGNKVISVYEIENTNNHIELYENVKKLKYLAKQGIQVYQIKIINDKPVLLWAKGNILTKVYSKNNIWLKKLINKIRPEDLELDSVKKISKSLLPLLLEQISINGNNLGEILKNIGKTKQALNYHLKQLIRKDFIRKVQSYPFAIYELTSLGIRVKEILRHGEDGTYKPLWECHNYEVGFNIGSLGSYQFVETSLRKLIKLNNWHYTLDQVGEFKVQITSTGKMVIHCPRRVAREPDNEFVKMGSEAQRIAQDYCNRYDMKLSSMFIVRKGQKTLKKSEALAKVLGKFHLGDVWTDNSDGTGEELEEAQDSNKIEQLMDLPKQINIFMQGFEKYNTNIELHLKVLQEIGEGVKELRNVIKELKK